MWPASAGSPCSGLAEAAGLRSEVLSYEGPFGVGYPVAHFGREQPAMSIQAIGRAGN